MKCDNLVASRKTKGISQEQMAKLSNMEQTTYSRKERGLSIITQEEWERFAKVLEVPVEQIKQERIFTQKQENYFLNNSLEVEYVNVPKELYDYLIKVISDKVS